MAQGVSLPLWDGVYPYSLVLVGDSVYYSDGALGAGYVWQVAKTGGVATPAFELSGALATAEYCLGGGGGENAGWLTNQGNHVYWRGCMKRLRDLDAGTGQVSRIGVLDVAYLASTPTHIFGTRQITSGSSVSGEIASFSIVDGAATTIATYDGRPGYLAVDDANVFWTDVSGKIMRVAQLGGVPALVVESPYPQGIAVDDQYVYWTDSRMGAVLRVARSGGSAETIATGQDTRAQIAVDAESVYWTDTSDLGLGSVMRISKSGGSAIELATGQGTMSGQHRGPWAVAVDDVAVYWTEIYGRGAVMRVAK